MARWPFVSWVTILVTGVLVVAGCGSDDGAKVEGPEGEIQTLIENWAAYLAVGDVSALEEIFDIAYWPSSPTALAGSDFLGANLSVSGALISVDDQNALAGFTLISAGESSMRVDWNLIDQGQGWKVYYEQWTDLP